MQNIISVLILLICPLLIGRIFITDSLSRARKPLLYISLSGTIISILLLVFSWKFKYDFLETLFNAIIYIFILTTLGYVWLIIKKNKWAKIGCLIPTGLLLLFISFIMIIDTKDSSWTRKKFTEQNYTVYWKVNSWDNTKEYTSIDIYKDVQWLPFLQHRIYTDSDINVVLESVKYLPETNMMELTLTHRAILSKQLVDLSKLD